VKKKEERRRRTYNDELRLTADGGKGVLCGCRFTVEAAVLGGIMEPARGPGGATPTPPL